MLTAVELRPACCISLTVWFPDVCNCVPFWASKQAVSQPETACFEAQNGSFRNAMRQPLHCVVRRLTLLNAAGRQSARVPSARLWLRRGRGQRLRPATAGGRRRAGRVWRAVRGISGGCALAGSVPPAGPRKACGRRTGGKPPVAAPKRKRRPIYCTCRAILYHIFHQLCILG